VDFRYSEEQLALQDTLQRCLARHYSFEQRRALSRCAAGHSPAAWRELADLGVLALPLPEEAGGLGGSSVDVMLVMEEFGRVLALEPYMSTVVIGAGILREAASASLQGQLLPQIAAGELRLALAAYEAAGRYQLEHVGCTAQRNGSGWRLSGRKAVVVDAPGAHYLLVSARTAGGVADGPGISLFLVSRTARGVTLSAYVTHCGGRAADVDLQEVELAADALLGPLDGGLGIIEHAIQRGIAALCAEALGIAATLNAATLEHLKTRRQFGVPIGTFQALQHRMADMYIAAEQARSMTISAATQIEGRDPVQRRRAVAAAKAYVGRATRFIGQQAVQLHGGMGLVDDFIVGHGFKRLTMIDMTFGDTDYHFGRFSDMLEEPPAS